MERKNIKLLLVEDNYNDSLIIQEYLSDYSSTKFSVDHVEYLKDGFEKVKNYNYDLILLDLLLPDTAGLNTLVEMQKRASNIPIIVLTGLDNDELSIEAVQIGAQDYIVKGLNNRKSFVRTINYALERHSLYQRLEDVNSKLSDNIYYFSKILDFTKEINKSLDIENLSSIMQKMLFYIFFAKNYSIFLLDKETNLLRLISSNHPENEKIPDNLVVEKNDSIMWNAILQNEIIYVERYSNSTYFNQDIREKYQDDRAMILPLIIENKAIGVLNLSNISKSHIDQTMINMLNTFAHHLAVVLNNIILYKKVEELIIVDDLSKLYNRRGFYQFLNQQIKTSKRNKEKFYLLYIDINDFKEINDTFGHQVGDAALYDTAEILRRTFRGSDIISRIGGDEFAVFPCKLETFSKEIITERINKNIANYCSANEPKKYKISLSTGLSEYNPDNPISIDEFINNADRDMYKNKSELKKKK